MHRCPNRACPSRGSRRCTTGSAPRSTSRASAGDDQEALGRGARPLAPDLYRLTAEQLAALDGFAELSAARAIESIQRSKEQPFTRVLFGLNIPKVGWILARNLARHFGSVEALAGATLEELEEVEGIGPDRAALIAEWFADEENLALVEELRDLGLQMVGRGRAGRRRARSPGTVRHHRNARELHARGGEGRARGARRQGLGLGLEEDDGRRSWGRARARRRRRPRSSACRSSPRTTCARCST